MSMKITRLYTHWEPEEAQAIIEFLDLLRDQLWEVHGDQIVEMLRETSATQIVDEHQTEFEFDDDIEF